MYFCISFIKRFKTDFRVLIYTPKNMYLKKHGLKGKKLPKILYKTQK